MLLLPFAIRSILMEGPAALALTNHQHRQVGRCACGARVQDAGGNRLNKLKHWHWHEYKLKSFEAVMTYYHLLGLAAAWGVIHGGKSTHGSQ